MSAASGCTGSVSPTPASKALEVVIAVRPTGIGPFAALAPIVGQPRFAHQLLEPRIGTRAGMNEQPRLRPGIGPAPEPAEVAAERGQREVPVSQRIRKPGIDFLSLLESLSENRQHSLAVRDGGGEVIAEPRRPVVFGAETLKQLAQGLRIGVRARQTAQQGR